MPPTLDTAASYRLSEVIGALSHALDLTEGQPVGHSQRSCMIGMEMADRLSLPSEVRRDLFYAILLKDAGCSSSAARMCELFATDDRRLKREFSFVDWTNTAEFVRYAAKNVAPGQSALSRAGQLLRALRGIAREAAELNEARCDRGARIVAMLGFAPATSQAVRALDEHWDGSGRPDGLVGDAIPLISRIACLAQTAEIFMSADGPQAALDVVRTRRGRWFDPELSDVFLAIGPDDPLWLRIAGDSMAEVLRDLEPGEGLALVDEEGLDRVSEAFAGVIDTKSPYTARHSTGVATYAVAIGEQMGFEHVRLRWLRRAGLLHDIGKLGVSNRILDKDGPLTDDEFAEVRRHPLYTHQILSRIEALSGIAESAASHHERLDGRGYHRGVGADRLPTEARILAVADVYEALTANRPYRGPLDRDTALGILWRDAGAAFDPVCIEALEAASEHLDGVI
jgi:HD-GYP domain-containing protein (c-di-GMP phosphodiesterase class II)